MLSRFFEYLKFFPEFDEQFALKKQTALQAKENKRAESKSVPADIIPKPKTFYAISKENVELAMEGQLGKLGRVFNDYPPEIEIEDKRTETGFRKISAIDPATLKKLMQATGKLIIPNAFTMVEFEESERPGIRQVKAVPATDNIKTDLDNYIHLLNQIAYNQLLDEQGNLHPEIIHFFGLQDFLNANRKDQTKLDHIKFQLIFSYITQILMSHTMPIIHHNLSKEAEEIQTSSLSQEEKDKAGEMIFEKQHAVGLLTKACLPYFYQTNGKVSDYFRHALLNYIFELSPFSETGVAEFLKHIEPEAVGEIAKKDLITLPVDLADYKDLYAKLLDNRTNFWMSVMNTLQLDRELLRLHHILNSLPDFALNKWKSREDTFEDLVDIEVEAEKELALIRQKAEAKEDVAQPIFTRDSASDYAFLSQWFNIRDNTFIIDHLLQDILRSNEPSIAKRLSSILPAVGFFEHKSEVMTVSMELQNIKHDPEIAALPLKDFFQAVFLNSKNKAELFELLQKTFPDIAYHINISFGADNPLIAAVNAERWNAVISLLLNKQPADFSDEEIYVIKKQRHHVASNLITYLETHFKDDVKQQLAILDRVIEGQNALGVILATPSNPFLYHFSLGATTGSLGVLIQYRDKITPPETKPTP